MPVREFGFICGSDLSVRMANGLVLPCTQEGYFPKSLIPGCSDEEIPGRYLLRVYHKGSVICKTKVEVAWGADDSQPEPFLAMKVADASALSESLTKAGGKPVELRFTKISGKRRAA